MRVKLVGAAAWVLGLAASAAAQQPGGGFPRLNPANVMPNVFNPQYQPLSPYLNLLRGGNPGVNYYYGVRPGTTGGGAAFGAGGLAAGGNRASGFNFQYTPDDALTLPEPGEGYILPPAGHPVVYNNTLGYFPGPIGQRGRPGMGGGLGGGQGGVGGGQGGAGGGQQRPATPRR